MYIFTKYGYFAINYLDDLGGAETEERAERAFAKLHQILKYFGLTEVTAKSCSPSHCMIFLGIEVNTVLFILRIPSEKLAEIVQTLDEWQDKIVANVKDVQILAGLLNFACRCIRMGRVYLSQILNFLRELPREGKRRIPVEVLKDVQWWRELAPHYNGVILMPEAGWTEPDCCICSDSCLTGGGACTAEEYFHVKYPKWVLEKCPFIHQLECVMLVVSVAKWAVKFRRKKMQMFCDNQVTVSSINSSTSRCRIIQKCLRYLHSVSH